MITLTCTRRAGRKKTQYHRLGRLGFLGPVDDGPEDVVELGDDVVGFTIRAPTFRVEYDSDCKLPSFPVD